MSDITTVIDLLTRGGLMTALIIALVGGMRGWYVWRNVHEAAIKSLEHTIADNIQQKNQQIADLTKDRDYWRDQAVRSMTNNERVTDAQLRLAKTP